MTGTKPQRFGGSYTVLREDARLSDPGCAATAMAEAEKQLRTVVEAAGHSYNPDRTSRSMLAYKLTGGGLNLCGFDDPAVWEYQYRCTQRIAS